MYHSIQETQQSGVFQRSRWLEKLNLKYGRQTKLELLIQISLHTLKIVLPVCGTMFINKGNIERRMQNG